MTREQIEALSFAEFKALHSLVCSVAMTRQKRNLINTSVPAIISRLAVGESHLFDQWFNSGRLCAWSKKAACKRLNNPSAQWTAKTTTKGVRVTRIN